MFGKLTAKISAFFAPLVGKIQWDCPPWMKKLSQKKASHPKAFGAAFVSLIILFAAAGYGYHWYSHLPQPRLVTAKITPPPITPLADEPIPNPLTIDFGLQEEEFRATSVAPLNAINKKVSEGIYLQPAMAGEWVWTSDTRLIFTPASDWPAGQEYTIKFDKAVFVEGTKMRSWKVNFSTEPFNASISEFKFYQDPINQAVRQAVATINFNFPVDAASLQKSIALQFQSLENDQPQQPFTLTFDKYRRTAWLHSENMALPENPRYLVLTLNKGIASASGTAKTLDKSSKNLLVPDSTSYFKITQINASIIRNPQDKPEQVLTVESTLGATEIALGKALTAYLLPENYPATALEKEKVNYAWSNPGEVTPAILALSTAVNLETIPGDRHYASLHSFKFSAKTPRFLYVKVARGVQGFGGFTLNNDYACVLKVPEFPKEISFLHKGALLALGSEQKLSVLIRGISAVQFQVARVLPENVNQLITQTQGDFNNPNFINQSFNQYNISEIFSTIQQFDASDPGKQQYTALDFSKYLSAKANTGGPQGLFLLQATAWDVKNNLPLDIKNTRLVLATDMGMVVKDNQDGSHDVFVQSIIKGLPVEAAAVSVLGKNGLPILTRNTDSQGRVSFPTLKDFIDEREPVAYLAALGNDVSFIPYKNYARVLNFSRFDIGGLYTDPLNINAFVFSDRGIYRPGDTVHLGFIVKHGFVQAEPAGLPLQVRILDPRGTTVVDEKLTLDASGYLSLDFPTRAASLTGQYLVNVYIIKDDQADSLLGSTTLRLNEFQPDRMRISAELARKSEKGWISPKDLSATVGLWNLYGTPAVDRKVQAKILLSPQNIHFEKYADYHFVDPLINPEKPAKVFTDNLSDQITNNQGQAEFKLNLERFDKATWQLTFFAEGFEAEGGRSVTTQTQALVSPLDYLVGFKADGDLQFLPQRGQRSLEWIAINPQLEQQDLSDLTLQRFALHPVSALVKKPDGTFEYQSIIQSTLVDTRTISIGKTGLKYALPTETIGDFSLVLMDKDKRELSKINYSVVGQSQQPLPKNAELQLKLNKSEYAAGETISLQITAPYTGTGLITIERDKVYAAQWFRTESTSSMQTIIIPADFEGDGYVNVSFVRDWNAADIFTSPLSYSIAPFSLHHEKHAIGIDLETPSGVKPGEELIIDYKTNRPGKIIVFAVDEGILQLTNFKTPDPLGFFFQKHALQVLTQQTLDQILPKFVQDRELSAVGGDDGDEALMKHLNPFKRKTDLPVVYWSGIIDADNSQKSLKYRIPDYFNGSLRIMAVAVAQDAVGSADKSVEVRGDFVINPNVPTFVAPGDTFDVTASIANNVKSSGDLPVNVQIQITPDLVMLTEASQKMVIPEGREKTLRFTLRANQPTDSANIRITIQSGDKSAKMDSHLSIRPATVFSTTIQSGSDDKAEKTLPINRDLYPQFRKVEATLSTSPLILIAGLQRYLENFPFGCTEQVTSQAWPLLAAANQPWFNKEHPDLKDKILKTISLLGQRQMSDGGLSYWPGLGDNQGNSFASVYAIHFLSEAKAQGYEVPQDILSSGMGYLRNLLSENPEDADAARIHAYAIYVLTRNEIVTTNYLTNLQVYLDQDKQQAWHQQIIGAYISATWQLLHNEAEANRLIALYKPGKDTDETSDFNSTAIANAQYLYLVAKHFPNKLDETGKLLIPSLVAAMNTDTINTLFSGYASLALSAYNESGLAIGQIPQIVEIFADKKEKILTQGQNLYEKASISDTARQVRFDNPAKSTYFYQLLQSGFERNPTTTALKQGIEISREYRDKAGNVITSTPLGSEIEVHIHIRTTDDSYLTNIAIVDLLPGGFEAVRDSVKTDDIDYADVREDRVLFFTSVEPKAMETVYRIKAVNTGEYEVPGIVAESMYDPAVKGASVSGKITVSKD